MKDGSIAFGDLTTFSIAKFLPLLPQCFQIYMMDYMVQLFRSWIYPKLTCSKTIDQGLS